MADGVWKGVQSQVIGRSRQLLLNKFFDPSTPSMRKGRDGGEKKKKNEKENNGGNSGHYVVANRPPNSDQLQRRRSCQLDRASQSKDVCPRETTNLNVKKEVRS